MIKYSTFMKRRADFFEVQLPLLQEIRPLWLRHLTGRKIHIKSRNGLYTVKRVTKHKLCLSCNKWDNEELWVDNSDFRCIAGGRYFQQTSSYHCDPEESGLPW